MFQYLVGVICNPWGYCDHFSQQSNDDIRPPPTLKPDLCCRGCLFSRSCGLSSGFYCFMLGHASVYCLGISSIWCICNHGNKSYWNCRGTIYFHHLWKFRYSLLRHCYMLIFARFGPMICALVAFQLACYPHILPSSSTFSSTPSISSRSNGDITSGILA